MTMKIDAAEVAKVFTDLKQLLKHMNSSLEILMQ